jgi:hypothetical protein
MENHLRQQIKENLKSFKGVGSMVIARHKNLTLFCARNSSEIKSRNLLRDNFYFIIDSWNLTGFTDLYVSEPSLENDLNFQAKSYVEFMERVDNAS